MLRFEDIKARFDIVSELFTFLLQRGLWWLIPMVSLLLLLGVLVFFAQNPVLAPFVYSIF